MSTMPETMAAKAIGLEVFAISLITNLAAGLTEEVQILFILKLLIMLFQVLSHTAVTSVANESGPQFIRFMKVLKFVYLFVTILKHFVGAIEVDPNSGYKENSSPFTASHVPLVQYY